MGWCRLLGFAAIGCLVCSTGFGASVTTYEAEEATTNGQILGPEYTGQTPAREASGRQCVMLSKTGQYLQFAAKADAQGIVIRYSIPDSARGGGLDATLGLYINDKLRQKLAMTSKYTYLYGDYPFKNDPSAGTPRHFWDELHVMPGEIHAGDLIRLEKDADDSASQYLIDFVELEQVPAALQQPGNSLSVTEFGATGDGQTDDHAAFVAAIDAAKKQHKTVWIPPGRFVIKGAIEVSDVTIQGAGMWYSNLVGAADYSPDSRLAILGNGSNITLSDFAISGNLDYRNDSESNDGIGGSFGTGSTISNIWVEHTKTGAWLTNSDSLVVDGCRFRDTIADGINLCLGMRNTTVRNCTVRGTGDDCFAIWPATYQNAQYEAGHNRIINCTAQLPFLAQGFSVYGGDGNSVEHCRAVDIPYGAGVLASTMFPTVSGFHGVTTFSDITMTRAGSADGAIAVMTNLRELAGLRFENINCEDSPTDGIKFACVTGKAISDTRFDHVRIVNPGVSGNGSGIVEARGAVGSATISDVTVVHPKTSGWEKNASAFNLIRGSGNTGLDSYSGSGIKNLVARETVVGR